jgi:hypothetical protein
VRIWQLFTSLCGALGVTRVKTQQTLKVIGNYSGDLGETEANDQVRAALSERGDSGIVPRDVRHYAYPQPGNQNAALEASIMVDLLKQGFVVEALEPAGVRFSQTREIASPDFDALTQGLQRSLTNVGWIYDGWESALVQGDNS